MTHYSLVGAMETLNQVLNGVASVQDAFSRVTFGVIPLGTGNDFAATLGLPENVDEAIGLLLKGRSIDVDLAMVATLSMCRPADSLRRCRMP